MSGGIVEAAGVGIVCFIIFLVAVSVARKDYAPETARNTFPGLSEGLDIGGIVAAAAGITMLVGIAIILLRFLR